MKKLIQVSGYFLCGIIMIVACLFAVIEGRLLFSGDWMLYEFAIMGALRYFCRTLIAISVVALCASFFLNMKKKNEMIKQLQKDGMLALSVVLIVALLFG